LKRVLAIASAFVISLASLVPQNTQTMVDSFKRNFEKADSLDVKIQILQDSIKADQAEMGPLYHAAVDYVVEHPGLLETESMAGDLAKIAVEQIGATGYGESSESLWQLFDLLEQETTLRVEILNSLGEVGGENAVRNVANWLETQNRLVEGGSKPNLQLVGQAVRSLGALGDRRGFPAVFTALRLDYSDEVTSFAREALLELDGKLDEILQEFVRDSGTLDKLAALNMALAEGSLTDVQKAEVAESALDVALSLSSSDKAEQARLREIRDLSALAIAQRNWSKATDLMIKHFDATLLEYDRRLTAKGSLLSAIAGLGAMGTHEAAVRLTLYLQLLNSYTEHGRSSDEQIMLTLVENLGNLGDKVAFDDLSFATYLRYSKRVIDAVKKAIENIKW
jgi:hypothetical protein